MFLSGTFFLGFNIGTSSVTTWPGLFHILEQPYPDFFERAPAVTGDINQRSTQIKFYVQLGQIPQYKTHFSLGLRLAL